MSDNPATPARLFDEEEVARILKRATELHQEEPVPSARSGGLSLEELEEIARETGIDPRHLRRAAMELDTGAGEADRGWALFFGENPTLRLETIVPGEVAHDDFERVVSALQRRASEHGQPSLVGRTLTWRAETSAKSRTMQVTVSSQDGATEIRVEERLHQMAGGIFGGGLGGIGGGVGFGAGLPIGLTVMGSAAAAIAFPLGVIGLTYIGAREVFRRVVRSRRKELAGIMDAVVLEVRTATERHRIAAGEGDADRTLPGG